MEPHRNSEGKLPLHCWNCQRDNDGACPIDVFASVKTCRTRANYRSYRRRIMQEAGCASHLLKENVDGRTVVQKIMDVLSDEWMPTVDISHWIECSDGYTRVVLRDLESDKKIERMWDDKLGITYWRKKQ